MSSAPSGLDVREYGYRLVRYTIPDGAEHSISHARALLITRIQFFAPATLPPPGNAYIITAAGGGSSQGQVFVEPEGCITLEPNGAYRGDLIVFGQGCILIVEAWFQATPNAQNPVVTIT